MSRAGRVRDLDQRLSVLPAGEAGDAPAGRERAHGLLAGHGRPRSGHEEADGTAVRLRPHLLRRDDEDGDRLGASLRGSGQHAQRGHARDRNPRHAGTVPPSCGGYAVPVAGVCVRNHSTPSGSE